MLMPENSYDPIYLKETGDFHNMSRKKIEIMCIVDDNSNSES